MHPIPILYHPIAITIIDDDSSLLNNLSLILCDHFKCYLFVSGIEGQQTLLNGHEKLHQNKYVNISYEDLTDISVDLKISDIYKEIYNDDRFSPSAIAIIDYQMPEINGLALARKLKAHAADIKIIMFTGEADMETAITAFNKNEIDRFIQKNSPDYVDKLISYINELQQEFFIQASAGILEYARNRKEHPLHDSDFITVFSQLAKENNIIEHYLLDDSGSFLMLDSAGKSTWLITRTEEDMRTYFELADGEHASKKILEFLKNREKIVLFSNRDSIIPPIEQWHFYPATQVKNKKIYYCVLKENEIPLHLKKIKSYKQFLLSE